LIERRNWSVTVPKNGRLALFGVHILHYTRADQKVSRLL
jgi:hypothetical protein